MSSTSEHALINARPRIAINGTTRANLGEAVLNMQIHLPRFGMASAELRLLNWGPTDTDQPDFLFQDLQLGNRIELFLGEMAQSAAFAGEITGIEERYGDGAPQIVLLAEDALHRLARQRHSRSFEEMSLDQIVRQMASEAGLQADVNVTSTTGTWLQLNESNLAFLLRQLAPYDVGLRLHEGKLRARDEEPDTEPLALDPGQNAKQIRLVADLNRLPRKVSVNGYNLQSDGAANSDATQLTPAPEGETGTALLEKLGWEGESVLPQPFARAQQEAQMLAQRQFRARANRFLHGEILCQGAIGLRSGREIRLDNVSKRLAGRYQIIDCWHQFDSTHGLVTRIQIQRPAWSAQ